jgi:dihydrofolate reductase
MVHSYSDKGLRLALIVAMSQNRVIGNDNHLPWNLPEDLKYFKSVTMGKPMVMGRKTFDSIGRPLPGRLNIVITRNAQWAHPGVETAASLEQAMSLAAEHTSDEVSGAGKEVMVIGGEQIYRAVIERADRLYITRVQTEIDGDAFFPDFDEKAWREVRRQDPETVGDTPYYFQVLERVAH